MTHGDVLEIVLLADDRAVAEQLESLSGNAFLRESAGFDGLDTLAVVFTSLAAPLLTAITTIVVAQIRAKKHVKLKYGKMVVEGVSEKKVLELLQIARDGTK